MWRKPAPYFADAESVLDGDEFVLPWFPYAAEAGTAHAINGCIASGDLFIWLRTRRRCEFQAPDVCKPTRRANVDVAAVSLICVNRSPFWGPCRPTRSPRKESTSASQRVLGSISMNCTSVQESRKGRAGDAPHASLYRAISHERSRQLCLGVAHPNAAANNPPSPPQRR